MSKLDLLKGNVRHRRAEDDLIAQALSALRIHLDMDVAYLAELDQDGLVFRAVDAPKHPEFAASDAGLPLGQQGRDRLASGAVPKLIVDRANPGVPPTDMPVDHSGFGSVIMVPVRLAEGGLFGVLCCLSETPDPTLNARDVKVAEIYAQLFEKELQKPLDLFRHADQLRGTLAAMIETASFTIHAQPIVTLADEQVTGYEALCRFPEAIGPNTEAVFDASERVGLRPELELSVIQATTALLSHIPAPAYLSLNASPRTVFTSRFPEVFMGQPLDRLVLELTEHQEVADYPALLRRLHPLREAGLRIAVDDAGRGYSGLHQILRLTPDIIKLDRALVQGIDSDGAKRAMCAAMVHYAGESDAILVAEGIETAAEADQLRQLGVKCGQGYHFGRPVPLRGVDATGE